MVKTSGKHVPLTGPQNTHTTQCSDKTLLDFWWNMSFFLSFCLSFVLSFFLFSFFLSFCLVWPFLPTHCMCWRLLLHQIPLTDRQTDSHTYTNRPRDGPVAETTHNIQNRQTAMPPVGLKPAIPASDRKQTYALDRAATGRGTRRELISGSSIIIQKDLHWILSAAKTQTAATLPSVQQNIWASQEKN